MNLRKDQIIMKVQQERDRFHALAMRKQRELATVHRRLGAPPPGSTTSDASQLPSQLLGDLTPVSHAVDRTSLARTSVSSEGSWHAPFSAASPRSLRHSSPGSLSSQQLFPTIGQGSDTGGASGVRPRRTSQPQTGGMSAAGAAPSPNASGNGHVKLQ